METLLPEESPLGDYLEGRGEGQDYLHLKIEQHVQPNGNVSSMSFAPASSATEVWRKPRNLIRPILRSNPLSRLRLICATIVNATLGANDNEGFLEQFRYQIIASQLLSDDAGTVASPSPSHDYKVVIAPVPDVAATTTGACLAAFVAFTLALSWRWAREGASATAGYHRLMTATLYTLICLGCIWIYTTRRSILSWRHNVLESTLAFTTNLQSLNSSSTSVIAAVQEMELLSRGYKLNHPLPPITRLDNRDHSRKTERLRRVIKSGFASLIPCMVQAIEEMRPLADQEDVDRYLDVYEIRSDDIDNAMRGHESSAGEDVESLTNLKIYQARSSVLRRLLLCLLLSLQATGRRSDNPKWMLVTDILRRVGEVAGELAQKLIKLLEDDEQPATPMSHRRRTIGGRDQTVQHSRVESQVRRISALSTGIRSLQAKLYLLREDSKHALANSTSEGELAEVSASLKEQYEGLGSDLQALLEAWEVGKEALTKDISKHERRVSQPSSPFPPRSTSRPATPEDAATAISGTKQTMVYAPVQDPGRAPLSPPVTDDGSDEVSFEDEIFETISSPRLRERSTLTRQERIVQAKEERERLAYAKQKRDTSASMVQELQTVIKLRPAARARRPDKHERVTSL
ncbi:MAG: hypothetical protein Q9162_006504 [Coniocarpon cinnabarinum]